MIVNYPKEHTFQSGITQNSVFLKGPKEWTDAIAKVLGSKLPGVTLLISNEANITDWDLKYAFDVDILSINFRGLQADNCILLPLKVLSRFPPTTYIYVDGRLKYTDILEGISSKCDVIKLDKPESVVNNIEEYFTFLTEIKTALSEKEKAPRQGGRKRV